MAKWLPGSDIGANEVIGRRIYEAVKLKGAEGQPEFAGLTVNHFLEKRGNEVSVDRLGRTGVERAIKTHLRPQAIEAGEARARKHAMLGWATVQAKKVPAYTEMAFSLTASPIEEPDNPYHAHLSGPAGQSATQIALNLRYLFESPANFENVADPAPEPTQPKEHLAGADALDSADAVASWTWYEVILKPVLQRAIKMIQKLM